MSYHEGSNWQAKKEDEGKPLYGKEEFEKDVNRKLSDYMNPVPKYPSKDNGYNRGSGKGFYEWINAEDMLKKHDVNIDRWPDTKKLIIAAMEEYAKQEKPSYG
jgi:hypothetical protein